MEPGHLTVIEALQNKPERASPSWYEAWKREIAAFLPWITEKLPEGKLVDEVSLLWGQSPGSIDQTEYLRSKQQTEDSASEINDQESFRSVMNVFGIRSRLISGDRLEQELAMRPQIIIVPYASGKKLTKIAQDLLLKHVQRGGMLLLDGETELIESLESALKVASCPSPVFMTSVSRMFQSSGNQAGVLPQIYTPTWCKDSVRRPDSQAPVGIQSQARSRKGRFSGSPF